MIRRYMIMTTRMKTLLMDKAPIDRNPVPLSTMPRMVMVIRISRTGDRETTTTFMDDQRHTTMRKMTMMTCGDCNVLAYLLDPFPCYLCIHDGVTALFISGWNNIQGLGSA